MKYYLSRKLENYIIKNKDNINIEELSIMLNKSLKSIITTIMLTESKELVKTNEEFELIDTFIERVLKELD